MKVTGKIILYTRDGRQLKSRDYFTVNGRRNIVADWKEALTGKGGAGFAEHDAGGYRLQESGDFEVSRRGHRHPGRGLPRRCAVTSGVAPRASGRPGDSGDGRSVRSRKRSCLGIFQGHVAASGTGAVHDP